MKVLYCNNAEPYTNSKIFRKQGEYVAKQSPDPVLDVGVEGAV